MTEEAKTKTAFLEMDTESFLRIINRALNTLEPDYWPAWAFNLDEVLPTDKLTLAIQRELPPSPGV